VHRAPRRCRGFVGSRRSPRPGHGLGVREAGRRLSRRDGRSPEVSWGCSLAGQARAAAGTDRLSGSAGGPEPKIENGKMFRSRCEGFAERGRKNCCASPLRQRAPCRSSGPVGLRDAAPELDQRRAPSVGGTPFRRQAMARYSHGIPTATFTGACVNPGRLWKRLSQVSTPMGFDHRMVWKTFTTLSRTKARNSRRHHLWNKNVAVRRGRGGVGRRPTAG